MFKRGLIGYLPANLIQGGIGFLTLIVFTRVLSPEAYGHYALAFGVTSFVHTLGFTWLEAAMARFWAGASRDEREAGVLYGTLYRTFAALAVAFAGISVVALWLIPLDADLKLAVGAGLASVVLRVLLQLVQEQRRAAGRVLPASMIDSVLTLAGFGFGVVLALAGLGGSAPLFGVLLGCAICLPFVLKEDLKLAAAGQFDAGALRTYAAYGFPIAGSLILTLGLYTLDRFLIAGFL
ncbi:MAG: lipopolysaccharide biosynthesis protein, partial [Asticcacaulis sp.]